MAQSNYDRMLIDAQKIFLTFDVDKMSHVRTVRKVGMFLLLEFFRKEYRISLENGVCECKDGSQWELAGFSEAMTIYDLLCHNMEPFVFSGNFIFLVNLTKMQSGNNYAGNGAFDRYAKVFDGRIQALRNAFETLGGTSYGKGDVSYRLPVYDGIEVMISFWESDDEFGPSLMPYVDDQILKYMHYETVWYMIGFVLDEVGKLVDTYHL